MLTTKLNVYGLNEIKDYLSNDRVNKALALGVNDAVLALHSTLRTSIFAKYNRPNDIEKALRKRTSAVESGKNFIRNGLVYEDSLTDLSKFPYTKYLGNLNEPKPRQGMVHVVSVLRHSPKKSHGKHGHGGFTIKKGNRVTMVERKGRSRLPLSTIYALTLVDMVNIAMKHDKAVRQSLDTLENTILDKFI